MPVACAGMIGADNDTSTHVRNLIEFGYSLLRGVLNDPQIEALRLVVDERAVIGARMGNLSEELLLASPEIRLATLLAHVLDVVDQFYPRRSQLLQVEVDEGGGGEGPSRSWHRDLSVAVSDPLTLTFILYLDRMDEKSGPTFVIPGSHIPTWSSLPGASPIARDSPHPAERAIQADPGDALVLSGSLWHSGSFPQVENVRRRIVVLQYGWWWIKRQSDVRSVPLDPGDRESITSRLFGDSRPAGDLYIYD